MGTTHYDHCYLLFNQVYFVGFLAHATTIIVFLFLVFKNYYNNLTSYVFVPTESDQPGMVCNNIASPISKPYYIDRFGYYSGENNFQYSEAPFYFEFNNYICSFEYYQNQIRALQAEVDKIGLKASNQTLATNLLYWMGTIFATPSESLVMSTESTQQFISRFSFTADPVIALRPYVDPLQVTIV